VRSIRALNALLRHKPKLKLSWLTDDLAVSRAPFAREWTEIQRAGIRSVLDLRESGVSNTIPASSTLAFMHIPIEEYGAPTQDAMRRATAWVAERIVEGPVLIHCREGIGRSPLIACASLVRLGIPLADAYEILHRARIRVVFTEPQIQALDRFAASRGSTDSST